ncbi:hypothetical protein AND_003720 [Anopheles darlingi]|uniref:Regulatory protein zeste n=1 Tax=Anopheles darlingi TaxID=43151 RepID=W5JNR2_ANODA|nr:hypothetical protein AND_003720 [Anopheles darlingi]
MKPMKKTNPQQFERLVELMKQNPEFARGCHGLGLSKTNVKQRWQQFGTVLNALGPPTRPGHEWQRVWMDMKGKVKKILTYNNRELRAGAAGEGSQPNVKSLTPLQREIDVLLHLSTNIKVDELSDDYEPTNAILSPSLDHLLDGQLALSPISSGAERRTEPPRHLPRANKRKCRIRPFEEDRYAMLKKQTKLLEQSIVQMAVIGENVAKLVGALNQQTLVLKQAVKLMEKNTGTKQ